MSNSTPPPETHSTSQPTDPEVAGHIALALSPHGNRPDLAQKQTSIRWLVDHKDRAFPIVLARAKASPNAAVLSLLGHFAAPESAALLREVFLAGGAASAAAAIALAGLPGNDTRALLVSGLADRNHTVVMAALDGLRVRGDRSVCPEIAPILKHANAEVRYVCVRAAAALGCVDRAALDALASGDADRDVRELAASLAATATP